MFCHKCGMEINENVKFCPSCGCPVINKIKEQKLGEEKANKKRKSKPIILIIAGCIIALGMIGILFLINTNQKKTNITSNNNKENAVGESNNDSVKKIDYQGTIVDSTFLSRDGVFLLETSSGEKLIVNKDGNIQEALNLKSEYLSVEGVKDSSKKQVYDMYGNSVQSRFITDDAHQKILGLCRMDSKDVIWVLESQETPTNSLFIVKCLDEQGTELCRIDSDNSSFDENDKDKFKYIITVEYSGDSVCNIMYSMANTQSLFSVNVDTSEIISHSGQFSDGYAIAHDSEGNCIEDVHGNIVSRLSYDEFKKVSLYSEGLFFSQTTNKFYDINQNIKIDLSKYHIPVWDKDEMEQYVFKDGYCAIQAINESGTRFYGVIDSDGNWIIELTDTLKPQGDAYRRKVTETKIEMGSRFYDIQTKQFQDIPDYLTKDNKDLAFNAYYFVNDSNEFCRYMPDSDMLEAITIN